MDPDVLARIRIMEPRHVTQVAAQHAISMGNSLWAKLGVGFLEALYNALLTHPDFVAFVYEEENQVKGFIAGSANGPKMFKDVFFKKGAAVAWAALKGALRNPKAAFALMETFSYFGKTKMPELLGVTAESMFCSFQPELRGKRISGLINKVLFDEMAYRNHTFLKITTEADNEGSVRQLTSWGFERIGRFKFYGKNMVAWRLDLKTNPRVEAVRWIQ